MQYLGVHLALQIVRQPAVVDTLLHFARITTVMALPFDAGLLKTKKIPK